MEPPPGFLLVSLPLLLPLLLTTCPLSLVRGQQSPTGFQPVCADHRSGKRTEQVCPDASYSCAVNMNVEFPIGCEETCNNATSYDLECHQGPYGRVYCCCKMSAGDSGRLPCNDVLNKFDDSVWKRACTLPELRSRDICKTSPVPVRKPIEEMGPECRNYCVEKKPRGIKYDTPYKILCGLRPKNGERPSFHSCKEVETASGNNDCPRTCDGFCNKNGTHILCPAIESPYGFKMATVDLVGALGLGLTLAIMLGAIAFDCVAKRRKRRGWTVVSQQEAPVAEGEEGLPEVGGGAVENPEDQQQQLDNPPPPPSGNPSQH